MVLSGPLSNALSRRFSARVVVFVGALLYGTGCVLCAFASSTEYMIVSYTLMTGLGGSLVYAPSVVVVSEYFDKRRSVAFGLATLGTSIGAFVVPPVMVVLFDRYGYSGGLLILGAVMYNCCVSGALYRPLIRPTDEMSRLVPRRVFSRKYDGHIDELCKSVEGHNRISHVRGSAKKQAKDDVVCNEEESRMGSAAVAISRLLSIDIWRDRAFTLFAVSQAIGIMSTVPVWMLLPSVAEDNNVAKGTAAFFLSAIAAADMVGRFTSGFLFDMPLVRHQRYRPYSACMMLMAFLMLLLPFAASYHAMLICAVVFGFFLGIVVAQRANVLRDLVGIDRFSGAFGMMVSVQGVGVFVGPFMAGLFRDYYGSYKIAFIVLAACMAVASVLSNVSFVYTQPK